MPIVWSENFGVYADTAAMLAVWSVDDPESLAEVSLGTERALTSSNSKSLKFVLSGGTPNEYPYGVRISRTVTGLVPGQPYTMTLSAYSVGPDGSGPFNVWTTVPFIEALDNMSATVVASATGTATVYLAPGIASGNPTATTWFDGITLVPVALGLPPFLLEPGLLYVNGAFLGFSRGGLTFDPNPKYDQFDFDGSAMAVAGTDQLTGLDPVLSGTIIPVSAGQLAAIEPASTTSTTGTITTTTPRAAHATIASGSLATDVRAVWRRAAGGYFQVRFPLALCTTYQLKGDGSTEPTIHVEFHARAAAGTPMASSYALDLIDAA